MKIVSTPIFLNELKAMAQGGFGNLVKAVVDVDRCLIALDGDLHADEEAILLESGSRQEHLWGINLYPEIEGPDFVEFDSVINIRPSQGNKSRGVDDPAIRNAVLQIIEKLVKP